MQGPEDLVGAKFFGGAFARALTLGTWVSRRRLNFPAGGPSQVPQIWTVVLFWDLADIRLMIDWAGSPLPEHGQNIAEAV